MEKLKASHSGQILFKSKSNKNFYANAKTSLRLNGIILLAVILD